ncbi:hypothetical protein OQA88_12712 [Cercophora sp. LCS_1]
MPTALGLTTTPSQSPAPPGTSNNRMAPPGTSNNRLVGGQRLDTISKRNHAAARENEVLLWRALTDSPEAAKEYMSEDCVMINPLFTGTSQPMHKDSEPSIEDALEATRKYTGFRFVGEPLVVEVGLMALASVYKIVLYKQGRKGVREVRATGSSSWRQTAGADWLLCALHVQFDGIEEEEEEEEE